MAVKKYLTPAQVLAAMRKDNKPSDKIKHVESVLKGNAGVYAVSLRRKVKIPPNKAKIYAVNIKNKRSAIFIQGEVEGKKATGILANVLSSSVGSESSTSRSSSKRSRSSSKRRKSSSKRRRSSSKRRKSRR